MAIQSAVQDGNQNFSMIAASGTSQTAEARRVLTDEQNRVLVNVSTGVTPAVSYDTITASYPSGTTEVYIYSASGTAVGTTTITYTDSSKGSISVATFTHP